MLNRKEFQRISYSQFGEDLRARHIFGDKLTGFYVDIGCHHPYRLSNTAIFHEQGWCGLNVDIDPETVRLFHDERPGDINVHCGVAGERGFVTAYMFNDGAVNTLDPQLAADYEKIDGRRIVSQQTIETFTLKQVLDRYLPPGQFIDLMSIDVEGKDEEVLRSNDFAKYRPRVLIIEAHAANLSNASNHPITAFLKQFGYELSAFLEMSLVFWRPSLS